MRNFLFNRKEKLPRRNLEDIKNICKVLFIDDKKFRVIDILKNANWADVRWVKDIDSMDQPELKEAHILFVDIQGVGKKLNFQDEGLGLIVAIKNKYPYKKIIVYSSEDHGQINAFHEGINLADSRLRKNADPYQFQMKLEHYAKEAFCLDNCIIRIKEMIHNEFGISLDDKDIMKNIIKIQKTNNYDETNIAKIFNIQNAAAIANIIQLFLSLKIIN